MTTRIDPVLPAGTRPPRPMERTRTAWRAPLVAAALVTAAAHVPVTGEHLAEAPYIGVLFIALEVASVLLAIELLRRPTRAVLLLTTIVGALAVLALVVSRTIGLPLIGDDVGEWAEPLAVVSIVAESLMAVGGVVALVHSAPPSRRALRFGLAAGLLVLVLGGVATGVATAAETAGGHDDAMTGMEMELGASR